MRSSVGGGDVGEVADMGSVLCVVWRILSLAAVLLQLLAACCRRLAGFLHLIRLLVACTHLI